MRTIRIKVYKFQELSKPAQEKAIDQIRNRDQGFYYEIAWDNTVEDAANIGLKIILIELHRPYRGEFKQGAMETAWKIKAEHGQECETCKTAAQFLKEWDELVSKYSDGTSKVAEGNEHQFDEEADELKKD